MASTSGSCLSQCADTLESRTDTSDSLFLTSCRQPSQYVPATTDKGEVGGSSPPRPTKSSKCPQTVTQKRRKQPTGQGHVEKRDRKQLRARLYLFMRMVVLQAGELLQASCVFAMSGNSIVRLGTIKETARFQEH